MSQVSFVRSALAALGVAFAWAGASALAADVTAPPPPAVYGATPVTVGMPGCETCQHGAPKGGCDACGKSFGKGLMPKNLLHKDKAPFQVTLCPGACFGYFQTQWRKWDEVCPYPYQGIGVTDAGRLPGGMVPPPPSGSGLAPPRPLDPKMTDPKMPDPNPKKGGSDLPPVPPTPPGGKFVP